MCTSWVAPVTPNNIWTSQTWLFQTWLLAISTRKRSFAPFCALCASLRTCVCALLRSFVCFCIRPRLEQTVGVRELSGNGSGTGSRTSSSWPCLQKFQPSKALNGSSGLGPPIALYPITSSNRIRFSCIAPLSRYTPPPPKN